MTTTFYRKASTEAFTVPYLLYMHSQDACNNSEKEESKWKMKKRSSWKNR